MRAKNSFTLPTLLLFVFVLLILSNYIDVAALKYAESASGHDNVYLSVVILQFLIFVLPSIFYCKLKGSGYVLNLNFKVIRPGSFFLIICSSALLISGTSLIKVCLYNMNYYSPRYSLFDKYIPSGVPTATDIIYIILAFAILPAIAEEFLFRSVALTEYIKSGSCGAPFAIVLTSFLYSLMYFSFEELPLRFFIGLVLAMTAYASQSVLSAVILHFLYNMFGLFGEAQLHKLIQQTDNAVFFSFILITIFLLALFLTLNECERIFYICSVDGHKSPEYLPDKSVSFFKRFTETVLSPSFLACSLISIVGTLGLK